MIRVGIPVIQHATAISVAAPRDILSYAEYHMGGESQDPASELAFRTEFVGLDDTPVRCGDSVWLTPQQVVGNAVSYDVILVPAFNNRIEEGLEANRGFFPGCASAINAARCWPRGAAVPICSLPPAFWTVRRPPPTGRWQSTLPANFRRSTCNPSAWWLTKAT